MNGYLISFAPMRAGEPANFFRPWLLVFFSSSDSGSGSSIFFKRLQLRLQGAKNMRLLAALAPALDYLLSLVKYIFPNKLLM